jgi:ABC-type uncharacterized transport system auxiliary subunit
MKNDRIKELEEENKLLQAREKRLAQNIENIQNCNNIISAGTSLQYGYYYMSDITVLELKYKETLEKNEELIKER